MVALSIGDTGQSTRSAFAMGGGAPEPIRVFEIASEIGNIAVAAKTAWASIAALLKAASAAGGPRSRNRMSIAIALARASARLLTRAATVDLGSGWVPARRTVSSSIATTITSSGARRGPVIWYRRSRRGAS